MNEQPSEQAVTDPHHHHAHETSDISVRKVGLYTAILVVIGIGLHFLLGALMNRFVDLQSRKVGSNRPLSDILIESGEPTLQVDPTAEMIKLRTDEDVVLNTYGWVHRGQGIIHIPIERAMELTAARGLPAREQPNRPGSPKD